jgi:hypothetical protein
VQNRQKPGRILIQPGFFVTIQEQAVIETPNKKEEATMKMNFLKRPRRLTRHQQAAGKTDFTARKELYKAVVTAALDDQFYAAEDKRLQHIRSLVAKNDPSFIAALATQLAALPALRYMCFVLIVELDRQFSNHRQAGLLAAQLVRHASDLVALLQYYALSAHKKSIRQIGRLSKSLHKGLGTVCEQADAAWLQHCPAELGEKLKEALQLIQPKPADAARQQMFTRFMQQEQQAGQWETELALLKQQAFDSQETRQAAFSEKWSAIVQSDELSDTVLLKNSKNIARMPLTAGAMQAVCQRLAAIDNPALSPFALLHYYRELLLQGGNNTGMLEALEKAALRSIQHITGFGPQTRVLVATDVSSSMLRHISIKSKVQNFDIGPLLALVLRQQGNGVTTGIFGDRWKTIHLPQGPMLAATEAFYRREGEVGYATNGYLAVEYLLQQQKVVDKVLLFTDCPLWNSRGSEHLASLWKSYKQIAPGARLYLFDLAGYDNTPLKQLPDEVYLIAGWNDKIFAVLAALEQEAQLLEKTAVLPGI